MIDTRFNDLGADEAGAPIYGVEVEPVPPMVPLGLAVFADPLMWGPAPMCPCIILPAESRDRTIEDMVFGPRTVTVHLTGWMEHAAMADAINDEALAAELAAEWDRKRNPHLPEPPPVAEDPWVREVHGEWVTADEDDDR